MRSRTNACKRIEPVVALLIAALHGQVKTIARGVVIDHLDARAARSVHQRLGGDLRRSREDFPVTPERRILGQDGQRTQRRGFAARRCWLRLRFRSSDIYNASSHEHLRCRDRTTIPDL